MAKILIVDDDADSGQAASRFLSAHGYEVEVLPNGRAALASILADTPDLILLDLFMPEMDGAGLLEILRSYLRLQSLPVVIWTGLPDGPMADRARTLKVNAILIKGKATPDDVLAAVKQELHRAPH